MTKLESLVELHEKIKNGETFESLTKLAEEIKKLDQKKENDE